MYMNSRDIHEFSLTVTHAANARRSPNHSEMGRVFIFAEIMANTLHNHKAQLWKEHSWPWTWPLLPGHWIGHPGQDWLDPQEKTNSATFWKANLKELSILIICFWKVFRQSWKPPKLWKPNKLEWDPREHCWASLLAFAVWWMLCTECLLPSWNLYVETLIPSVTEFAYEASKEAIKVKWGHKGWVPYLLGLVSL